jgi:hypothetical protein
MHEMEPSMPGSLAAPWSWRMNSDLLWAGAFLFVWILLQQIILPRLGVPT